MTVTQESFEIERRLQACPAHVFACWADPALKRQWFVDSDGPGWLERDYTLDFRVGGTETGRFVLTEGPGKGEHANVTYYLDIVRDERIVYAYSMAHDGRIHSGSLVTVTFAADGGGTRLKYVEQGSFFAPSDGATGRRQGWDALLTALEATLARTAGQAPSI